MALSYLAVPERDTQFAPLELSDLDAVLDIELSGHAYPWPESVFRDCFKTGYECWGLWTQEVLMGFAILAWQYDELHLLNLCVRRGCQRSGLGRRLLRYAIVNARSQAARSVVLEVRESNAGAIQLYRGEGFAEVGRRKGYYPAGNGREDAIVMTLSFEG